MILSPKGLQGVSSVRTFFNALGSLEEDLVYNWTCRRKTLAKTKETGRGKERHAVESLKRDDIKEMCGCQSTMQHSQVGESAANGAIENAIQRVQRQVKATELDVGSNIKAKLIP